MIGFLLGLIFVLGCVCIAFLINPLIGVALLLWVIGVSIYTIKKIKDKKNRRK